MARKYVEQLTLQELNYAFSQYIEADRASKGQKALTKKEMIEEWRQFWGCLRIYCTVVERT